ncbi:MAG TPA: hypothetical protein VFH70_04750 [Acidimicrobiales bacterium]|nr:hypothetical protein [Acidimicrobiales bacterium]
MARARRAVTAVGSVVALLVLALPATRSGAPAAGGGTAGKVAGATLPWMGAEGAADTSAVAKLGADGFNTLSLFVWWVADSPRADSIHSYAATQPDQALSLEIEAARSAGLQVSLTPVIWCTGCQGGWRGTMAPAHPDAFFASYRAFIDHYAELAQSAGATMFFAGSEMASTEAYTAQWQRVIADVRTRFHGTVAYELNWANLGMARFLRSVDMIGVSAYFPLDDQAEPSLGRLLADWHHSSAAATRGRDWFATVAGLSAANGRPIIFGEAGYMAGQYAGRAPYLDFYGITDWALQADLYQAMLETFQGQSWWAGVMWWDWETADDGPAANGRTFRAKTAEDLLTLWYRSDVRPSNPAQPLLP